ncbi:hypothetical protein OO012_10830 [Rhodobacteraceae bacterium KMM 6894]|nr:hypothetical protein [Rhodobacteraceae bacterium KMM 6894]
MTRLLPTVGLICLLASPALACEMAQPDLTDALRQVLTASDDPRVADLVSYMNERFYSDLSCRLDGAITPDEVLGLRNRPSALIDLALAQPTPRNQSDALMLMLSAMQEGAKT